MGDDADGARIACSWCGLEGVATDSARGVARCPHCGAVQKASGSGAEPYAVLKREPSAGVERGAGSAAPVPLSSPARSKPAASGKWRSFWHESARRESVLAAETAALLALSLADLFTTYHLLRGHPGAFESNPVARMVFERWNIAGMGVFKLSLVAFVIVVGEVAERRRPGLGRFVLLVGCVATAAVVVHGLRLALGG